MAISGTDGASEVVRFASTSIGTSSPVKMAGSLDFLNSRLLSFTGVSRGNGTGIKWTQPFEKKRTKPDEIQMDQRERISLKLEAIDVRLMEYIRRIDENIEHTKDMTQMLLEAGRKEMELIVESNREKTELLLDANRNETILKIETNKRETELLIRSIKESTDRTEMRFREDNEKAEARIEKLARELKDSNNRIHGYAMVNIVGFASLLIAIVILVWSIKTIEFPQAPTPTVNINQAPPIVEQKDPESQFDFNID
jgi:hypothetical protein